MFLARMRESDISVEGIAPPPCHGGHPPRSEQAEATGQRGDEAIDTSAQAVANAECGGDSEGGACEKSKTTCRLAPSGHRE